MSERTPVLGEASAFSDYTTVLGARAAFGLLAVVASIFTTRLLTPSEFGSLSLFYVISLLTGSIASSWTSAAVSRFGREELEQTGRMGRITIARAVFVLPAFLIAAPAVLALWAVGALPSGLTAPLALLSICYTAVWIVFDHGVYMLEAWGRQKLSALAVLIQQVVYVAIIAGFFLSGASIGPAGIALLATCALALVTTAILVIVHRVAFDDFRPDRAVVRRVWQYSYPLIAFVASQYVMRSVDLLVIGTFATSAAVGIYALAYQGYGLVQMLGTVAGPVFTPLLVSLRLAERRSSMRLFLDDLAPKLGFLAAALTAIAMAPAFVLLPHVFGPGFESARTPLVVLLAAGAVYFEVSLCASVVTVFDRTRATAKINIAAAATNATLDLLLIGVLHTGIWAAAAATLASVSIIWLGYTRVAAECLESDRRRRYVWLLPLPAGAVPLLALSGAAAPLASCVCSILSSLAVFRLSQLFARSDVVIVEALDMPAPLRRWTARLLLLTRA